MGMWMMNSNNRGNIPSFNVNPVSTLEKVPAGGAKRCGSFTSIILSIFNKVLCNIVLFLTSLWF